MNPFKSRITAAEGYIELGMPLEANEELKLIDPEQRTQTEVMALRIDIHRALKQWELMQTVARSLALRDRDNVQWTVSWAYATRRADCLDAARLILINAVEHLPNVTIFHYNLACYECQLGNLEAARKSLKRAIDLDSNCRLRALEDKDLEAVWDSLRG